MRLALVGLLALTFTAGCDQPSAHKTVGATSSSGSTTGGAASTGGSGSSGTSAGSGSGSTGSAASSTGSSGSLLGMCMACSTNAECQSGYCDRATSRCNSSVPCDTDPSVCSRSGLTCDNQARICQCGAGSGSSGSASSASSSSSGSSGSSGSACSCDGCTNLGLGCDVANNCSCTTPSTTGGTSGGSTGGTTGNTCVGQRCVVYAETDHDLYQVDPANPNNLTHLCAFNGALGSTSADSVNDIAVRSDGSLYAITKTDLYTVDPQTCAATWVAQVAQGSQSFNCLSFTSAGDLVAATSTGQVSLIDPSTGSVSANVGSFGNSLGCSGDLVIVNNGVSDQIFATAKDTNASGTNDILVKLDPTTFHATKIGHSSSGWTGYKGIFGLGFWGGDLYGFDKNGNVLQIDVGTGVGTLLTTTNPSVTFYGAGTTPLAPIVNR